MGNPKLTITVNGKAYGGWKSIRVTRSLEALCGSFNLTVSDKRSNSIPINKGDACTVAIDSGFGPIPVVTGYVDRVKPSFDARSKSISIEGRDKAADIVDCSAQLGAWQFTSVNVLDLASKICAPYGVKVSLQPGIVAQSVSLPKKYSIDPGDTAGNALENLCRVAGLLSISDGLGGVLLTRAGTEKLATILVEGQNLLSGGATYDDAGRYRDYIVMGSHKGRDDLSGPAAHGVRGSAKDMNARAGRTLVVRPDSPMTVELANKRAQWEASVRAARGDSVSCVVQGWVESAFDAVWPLNKLVRVKSPSMRVNGEGLITGVTLSHDESNGTVTQLDLRDPRSFATDPTIGKSGGNNYWIEIVKGV